MKKQLNFITNGWFKNLSSVILTTVVAQLLPLVLLTILTRILSEKEVGIYVLWTSLAITISLIMSLKFDTAILNAQIDKEVDELVFIVFLQSLFFIFIAVLLSNFNLDASFISNKYRELNVFLLPLMFYSSCVSLSNCLQSKFIYKSNFRKFNQYRLIQSTFINLSIIVLCFSDEISIKSIILCHTIASFIPVFIYTLKGELNFINQLSHIKSVYETWKTFKNFPLYTFPAEIFNNLSQNAPFYFILNYFDGVLLGFFSIITKTLNAPLGLISRSMVTVFKDEASREYRETKNIHNSFIKYFKILSMVALILFISLYLILPELFIWVYGEKYLIAGNIAKIMIPLFLLRFISGPLSFTLLLVNKQEIDFLWQIILFSVSCLSFVLVNDFMLSITIYTTCYSVLYLIQIFLSYIYSK